MKESDFILSGYEDLEISSQILIRAALRRGIEVEILNRSAHFLRLSQGTHFQLVKEASKTAADSYITFLAMEDKHVSKLLLREAGLAVPQGQLFESADLALQYIQNRSGQPLVIKPNSTNFGDGVQVFDQGASLPAMQEAVRQAFTHDQSILIEDFVAGQEYRFLVIGNRCLAVCRRVPANVIGDGRHSIRELVELKNDDIRRGIGHRKPLEKIQIDAVVLAYLQSSSLTPESVPAKDQQVFLRQNSNISTGGDSIDETDHMHPAFLKIACQAAQAAQAKICGVDLIIADPRQAPEEQKWAILEINFNPVLYIHEFPYQGQGRPTADAILDLLGFT